AVWGFGWRTPARAESARKAGRRRRSGTALLAQLRREPQHVAAPFLAVSGQRTIAAGGVHRAGGKQLLQPLGARHVEPHVRAARQFCDLLKGFTGNRVAALVKQED